MGCPTTLFAGSRSSLLHREYGSKCHNRLPPYPRRQSGSPIGWCADPNPPLTSIRIFDQSRATTPSMSIKLYGTPHIAPTLRPGILWSG